MAGQQPNIGSRVNREVHARFWERPEVKFLRATRPIASFRGNAAIVRFQGYSDRRRGAALELFTRFEGC